MKSERHEPAKSRWQDWAGKYGLVLLAYLFATSVTGAHFMGDTADYAASITTRLEGGDYHFWEFGHLFWRPLGWACYQLLSPLTRLIVGPDVRLNVVFILCALNWFAGLGCALLLNSLVRRLAQREWIAGVVTVSFIFTNAFLNYAQTGNSYVTGLAFLFLGLYLLLKDDSVPTGISVRALGAGASLALSVCFWFPYILSVPACLVAPLLLFDFGRERLRLLLQASLAVAFVTGLAYLSVAVLGVGVRDVAGFKAWFADASHGMINMGGAVRAVFGFARSLINMGDDGRIFKRFILHDPFNPVSLSDLFRLSIWKVMLFYGWVAAIIVSLLRYQKGRRVLALLLINAVPLFIFAIFLFTAGDIERYLPLYPLLFLLFALALRSEKPLPGLRYLMLAFVVVTIVVNASAMLTTTLARQREVVEKRVRELQPQLKPGDKVALSHFQDELVSFNNNFLFNPLSPPVQTIEILEPNTVQVERWREHFARRVVSTWQRGNEVWVTRRVFEPRPRPEWNWVEGNDPRVSWTDLYQFFSRLETNLAAGGEDGFAQLARSPANERLLNELAREQK